MWRYYSLELINSAFYGKKIVSKSQKKLLKPSPEAANPYAQYFLNCHICTGIRLNKHTAVAASLGLISFGKDVTAWNILSIWMGTREVGCAPQECPEKFLWIFRHIKMLLWSTVIAMNPRRLHAHHYLASVLQWYFSGEHCIPHEQIPAWSTCSPGVRASHCWQIRKRAQHNHEWFHTGISPRTSQPSNTCTRQKKRLSKLCSVFTFSWELWGGSKGLRIKFKRITPKGCTISVFLKP